MNRIDRFGQRVWSETGIFLINTGTEITIVKASDDNYYVQVNTNLYRIKHNGEIIRQETVTLGYPVSDPEGGVVLSGRVWTGMIPKLVAQRKDSLGSNLWQEPYVEIADSLHINTHLSIQCNNGYFYYSWYGKKNGIDKVAQFQALRLDGSKLFADGSIQVGIPPLNGTIVVPLEQNKTAFIYYNNDFLPDSLLVQTYDTLGNKLWNENGILIAYPPIEYQSYSTDGNGGFIIGGVINNFTVVAQQISRNGKLGQIITHVEIKQDEQIPQETLLFQNYPNPFNPTTMIKYELPKSSDVTLIIYDILGREVKSLINENQHAGRYEISFNASGLASGVYIYQLRAKGFVSTRKMILLK
jgi:hypothetical protein